MRPRVLAAAVVLLAPLVAPTIAAGGSAPPPAVASAAASPSALSPPIELTLTKPVMVTVKGSSGPPIWLQPLLTGILSAVTGIGAALLGVWAGQRTARATIHQKANEAELASIQARLAGFYGPFLQVAEENLFFYEELRARQPKPETFSLLLALIQPSWLDKLSQNDKAILDQIIANGETLRTLIRENSGAVDSVLSPFLARAATHFTVLGLARQGALTNDAERFAAYVYPKELDEAIAAEVERLDARAKVLRTQPDINHEPLEPLKLSVSLAPQPRAPRTPRTDSASAARPKKEATKQDKPV